MSERVGEWLEGPGQLYGSPCMSCGEARREVGENGGWCDLCSGIKPHYDPGCVRRATEYLLNHKSAATRAEEARVEEWWREYQETRRQWRQSHPAAHPDDFRVSRSARRSRGVA